MTDRIAEPIRKLARLAQNLWLSAEEEVDRLKLAADQRDRVIATIITNLKQGRTPEQVIEWFEGEGQTLLAYAMLAARKETDNGQ